MNAPLNITNAIAYTKALLPWAIIGAPCLSWLGSEDGQALIRVPFADPEGRPFEMTVWDEGNGCLYGEW